ncbi:MAG: peptidylprolyl isomerase [Candidatus Thorarchaeota archaeon]
MAVKKGDHVKVQYKVILDDGTVFDSIKEYGKPLEFEIGLGRLIKGLEEALIGMGAGEEKKITVQPAQAYGDPKPELIRRVERGLFPKDVSLQPGMIFKVALESGAEVPGEIVALADEQVIIDLNHPLAGRTLNFEIKVISISS